MSGNFYLGFFTQLFTARQERCGKVMFSRYVSFCISGARSLPIPWSHVLSGRVEYIWSHVPSGGMVSLVLCDFRKGGRVSKGLMYKSPHPHPQKGRLTRDTLLPPEPQKRVVRILLKASCIFYFISFSLQ